MDRQIPDDGFEQRTADLSFTAVDITLVSKEPRTLMPWEIATLGPTNTAHLMALVLIQMRLMHSADLSGAALQSAAEAIVLEQWKIEESTRGDIVRTLSSYGNTHFNLDEDDRYDD